MTEKKSKIVYETGDLGKLSSEELNTKRLKELTRRVDEIATALYADGSECALRKIKDFDKRLDCILRHLVMNENESRILREAVSALQRRRSLLLYGCQFRFRRRHFIKRDIAGDEKLIKSGKKKDGRSRLKRCIY